MSEWVMCPECSDYCTPGTIHNCRYRGPVKAPTWGAAPGGPSDDPHPRYGPCDGFGPGGECAECAKARFPTEAAWEAWLMSDMPPESTPSCAECASSRAALAEAEQRARTAEEALERIGHLSDPWATKEGTGEALNEIRAIVRALSGRTAPSTTEPTQEREPVRCGADVLARLRLSVLVAPPEDRERALDAYVQARITQAIHAMMDADTYSASMGRE